MHVNGPTQIHGPQAINAPHRTPPAKPSADGGQTADADQLDISPEAAAVSRVRDLPEVRSERVAEIKAAIADGTYDTDEKLDIALDRLLDEIA